MPTYEYVCGKCGHEFERFHSILAEPVKKCPECGKNAVTRKIGMGGGVLFKGGGFYETDYRSEGYTKAAEAEKGEAKAKDGGEGKKDGKGEAKPEPKTEPKTEPKPDAKPESKPAPKPEAKSEPSSNATHRSRVGRGIGNILQNPPKPKPAPKAKPAGKSRRK
jgi:putative FmdB family regulatory protein